MIEKTKKQKKSSISEEDISTLLQRYTANTVLALLQEVAQFPGVKLNWDALVKKTSTGISNAREYQMLWRHLAYRDALLEKLEDGSEPLDDDSDLEYELEPSPSVSSEALADAAACVKVLIASGLTNDSNPANSSRVEAPLTINIPNSQSSRVSENLQPTCSMQGMNITVPVSVQKQVLPVVTSAETVEGNRSAGANLPARRKRKPWSKAEDLELIAAVQKCGVGNWANILRGDFKGDRSASQLSQRWTVIKKQLGNLNVEGSSTIPQLSEAQLAARSALSLALDMPDKNLTAACANNPGLKATSSNLVLPNTNGETSLQAQNQFQKGLVTSIPAQNQSQNSPKTSVSVHNQPQKGSVTSLPSHNQPRQSSITSVSTHNNPHQGLIISLPAQIPSQQGPVASVQVPNQSQPGPGTTKTSPTGSSGSTLKSRVTLKKPQAKSFPTTCSILEATAVAAGARIGSPEAAASLLKAAQSKNAIHIITTGGSNVKSLIPSGNSSHLEAHSNLQCVSTGPTAEPLSSAIVATSTLHPGSVKSAMQRVDHAPSISSPSLNVSIQQCNAVTTSPTVEGALKEKLGPPAEIKGSVSESLPNEVVQENRACLSKNEPDEGVQKHKAAVSNPESEIKNIEAVFEHPNEKLMVKGDQVHIAANLVKESISVNNSEIDFSLVQKVDSQPVAEDANNGKSECSLANKKVDSKPVAEESSGNQIMIKTPDEASSNDGCAKKLDALSTAETGQAT